MTPLLATKLSIPPLRRKMVSRPHLFERLSEGLDRKLTLVSASAGCGKTTLVSAWVQECGRPAAWLSLDGEENDPARFLACLIEACQTLTGAARESALELLQSSQPPQLEMVLAALLTNLAVSPDHFVLVLDDYHLIETPVVDRALTYLIDHMPPQMHLVISTREDPRLPLPRLRARDQLTELRSADLRFSTSEAAIFLTQVMGLNLSVADSAQLAVRTEGWITGLQLAALSLRGQQDVAGFIRAFAGDHRYIVDYLVEEVLQRQPEAVRRFLLQTAILDRLYGPLCDAVTGESGSGAQLEALERSNLLVIPLDETRRWYRYHHLFAEALSARLQAEQPDQVVQLHRRASEWYEQHGAAADSIRHALAAADFERAAKLIELAIPAMRQGRQDVTLLGWLKALPVELIRVRPVLCAGYAWTLLASGDLEAAHARLQDAERWLDTSGLRLVPSPEMVVVDEEEGRRLPALIAVYRAGRAQVMGDIPNTIKYARRVLDLSSEDDPLGRGAAVALLGLASWVNGDLEDAYRTFADGIAHVRQAGNISDAISGTIFLADIKVAQGRLHEAMRLYERVLQEATGPVVQGIADLYVGMSELYREHGDVHAATLRLLQSKELGERTGLPQDWSRWHVAQAQIMEAQGDLDGALSELREAERLYRRDFAPDVRPIAALVARVWIAQGRLGEAHGWVRERGLTITDELSYLREFEHITLARVLLARYKSDRTEHTIFEARELLERLLKAAQEGGRMGSTIEILVLLALAYQMQGNSVAALKQLQQALTLAEPEGYVRLFVDEGPPMIALLEEAARRGIAPNYVRQLLSATGATREHAPMQQGLVEPLSDREREVLRLLGTDLSGPEIARELIVSLNTVRTHTKNIYSKLGVNNRRAAIRRSEELDLL